MTIIKESDINREVEYEINAQTIRDRLANSGRDPELIKANKLKMCTQAIHESFEASPELASVMAEEWVTCMDDFKEKSIWEWARNRGLSKRESPIDHQFMKSQLIVNETRNKGT